MSALLSSNGSSRLYDTATDGSLIDMMCSIRAELVQPSADDATREGELEIKLCSMTENSSSDTANMLRSYEMALQKYYVPCLLNSIRQRVLEGTSESSVLCVIPGTVVWKLYVDVYILSLWSQQHTYFAGSSVYYLDAVTHCVNAALYETVLPSLTTLHDNDDDHMSTSAILTNIALDADRTQPLLSRRTDTPQRLPVVISVHAIPCRSNVNTAKETTTLILDASTEEAAVASFVVHTVVVPCDEGYRPGAVWTSTTAGSLPVSSLPESWHLAQMVAPLVYQHYS
jgi:exosome complex RNA-binding protein Rrp42 (RNase PH superfamily)